MKRPELRTLLRWLGPLALLAALLLLRLFGDRWWLALPLLYGPRWMLAPLLLTPLLGHRRGAGRRTAIASLVAIVAFMLVLDFRLPWRALLPHRNQGQSIRMVTWNVQGGGPDVPATAQAILDQRPEIVVITECRAAIARELSERSGLALHQGGNLCLLTRFPVSEWAPRDPRDFWDRGGSGAIARMVVDVHGTEVVVGAVHLETPRGALTALAKRALFSFPEADTRNRKERQLESEVARSWIAPPGEARPVIIAGDFNLVVESAVYDAAWGDLSNAFSQRGVGLGWTKRTQWFGARIDHVLVNRRIAVRSAAVGTAVESDHHLLVVELIVHP